MDDKGPPLCSLCSGPPYSLACIPPAAIDFWPFPQEQREAAKCYLLGPPGSETLAPPPLPTSPPRGGCPPGHPGKGKAGELLFNQPGSLQEIRGEIQVSSGAGVTTVTPRSPPPWSSWKQAPGRPTPYTGGPMAHPRAEASVPGGSMLWDTTVESRPGPAAAGRVTRESLALPGLPFLICTTQMIKLPAFQGCC